MQRLDAKHVQLNEKISSNTYRIIYPETLAKLVITDEEHRFVSDADKEKWNNAVANGLVYAGPWYSSEIYTANTIVTYNDKHFLCLQDNGNQTPDEEQSSDKYWLNINFEAFLADNAENIRVTKSNTNTDYYLTFVDEVSDSGEYLSTYNSNFLTYNPYLKTFTVSGEDHSITINAEEGTVTANSFVGDLTGNADTADHADEADVSLKYQKYERDADGELVNGYNNTDGTEYIDEKFVSVDKAIDSIKTEGVHTKEQLIIKFDGTEEERFDGKEEVTVDIKQTYTPQDIDGLLDNATKIKLEWLPDSVLGQLSYMGTWDPNSASATTTNPKLGDYYIATKNGNYNPEGKAEQPDPYPEDEDTKFYFRTGDWAVYDGAKWDKVDNTDAVTSVNGRLGNVQIHQGSWKANTSYHKGDIVKKEDTLFICNTDHTSAATFNESMWDIFGRNYVATDGIKIDDKTTIKHDVTLDVDTTDSSTLNSSTTITTYEPVRDSWGHVTQVKKKVISLGDDFIDTTRPIKIGGTSFLSGENSERKTPVNFMGDDWIQLSKGSNAGDLKVNHNTFTAEGKEIDKNFHTNTNTSASSTVTHTLYPGTKLEVPTFKIDDAGHIAERGSEIIQLASSLVEHSHFSITQKPNGTQVIGAYSSDVVTSEWLKSNPGKFYLGTTAPVGTIRMTYNGALNATTLLQSGNKVLDSSTAISSGVDYYGSAITGSYDESTNTYSLGKSVTFAEGETYAIGSAIAFNAQGIVVGAGKSVEFGTELNANPSDALMAGGLFFRLIGE